MAALLAPVCAACSGPLDAPTRGPVCDACWRGIVGFTPPLCARCGEPLPSWRPLSLAASLCPRCRRAPSPVSRSAAIGPYDGRLRSIVHALKYGERRTLAAGLATRLRQASGDVLSGVDGVVPVPLHRRRQRARGFNQAMEIARHLGVPVYDVLRRTRATRSQTGLRAAARRANVRGAFVLRRRANVAGLHLVLVDDVCTTGATLDACASVLRDAGAGDVRAATVARVATRRRA